MLEYPTEEEEAFLAPQEKYEIWMQLVKGETALGEAAERSGVDRSTIAKLRDVARQGASEAANIISDLLIAARADIGGVSVTHDAVAIETEVDRVLAIHPHEVDVSGADELPPVCADSGRIQQVLRNLITNAIRYRGPGHRIVSAVADGFVSVEVRDDGAELPQDEMDALFEPYARAHEGAGITESVRLGLTVARHLAGLMGGSLVAFRDEHETVFRLEIPVWGRCPVRNGATSRAHV